MDETQYRDSRVRPSGLEDPDPVPSSAIGLSIVRNDHAYAVAAARKRSRKQGLLHRLAADGVLSVLGREDRQVVQPDQADPHIRRMLEAVGDAASAAIVTRLVHSAHGSCQGRKL
jgi:hypothetical protein